MRAERYWARQIPADVAKRAQVVFASDYAALEARCAYLQASLEKYQACRVHDVDEKAWLSKRVTELEAALREINAAGLDGHTDPLALAIIASKALGHTSETACEHEWGEYAIDNAKSPADPPERYVWIKCIKCGEPQGAATSNRTLK